MPIEILPQEVVSLIAAGEVIENPASVLKELIENSIDANANEINIDIEKAGKQLIRVADNGYGMSEKDLKTAILPHTTSKIKSFNDILNLHTYGFRGEALYSIFSVSKIKITSWDGKSETGFTLSGEGGNLSEINILPAPPVKGTIIEVNNLFFNTPARKKFLKNDNSLKAELIKVVEDFLLSHPEISLSLKIDRKEIFNERAGKNSFDSIFERAKKIFAGKTSENLIKIEAEKENVKIYGFISNPSNLIATRASQYTFVNKRSVENKTIRQAIYKAYENIRNGRHPAWALFIEIAPDKLDINVHPQKKEIKFSEDNFVYEFIRQNILLALSQKSVPEIPFTKTYQNEAKPPSDFTLISEKTEHTSNYAQTDFIEHITSKGNLPLWYNPPITFIGQLFNTILLFQTRTSLLLIDQHAAVERIIFEKYLEDFKNNLIQIQNLLLPVLVEMSPSNIEHILQWKDWLKKAGFEINRNSLSSIMVYSTPAIFYFSPEGLSDFFSYLSEILGKPDEVPQEIKRESIAMLACKKSIKARDKITKDSAIKILEDLKQCSDPMHCPHGRPIILELTSDELIKKFGRSSI